MKREGKGREMKGGEVFIVLCEARVHLEEQVPVCSGQQVEG